MENGEDETYFVDDEKEIEFNGKQLKKKSSKAIKDDEN